MWPLPWESKFYQLLTQQEEIFFPDDQTGLFSSPDVFLLISRHHDVILETKL